MREYMEQTQKEKKVEYLELIYDLIFVYIIGRNNSLLHNVENGFVSWGTFLAYVMCTLAIIQIWNYSTFYINLYGRNGIRDHVFLFINMYLLYHMADGTSIQWQSSVYRYSAAWALILINLGIQYIIELKTNNHAPWEEYRIKRNAAIIFIEAALVVVHMAVFAVSGISMPYIPIAFGIFAMLFDGKTNMAVPIDFAHLSERAMLYIVFTFGEMIISIASYFSGGVTLNVIYFSLMAFLIVVGLFLSYGTLYNRIIDREMTTNGKGYMMIHIFLIFALNNISVSLEFMREEEVSLLPKTLFLTVSFLIYFSFMFLTTIYAKQHGILNKKRLLWIVFLTVCFVTLMMIFRGMMYVNIAVTLLYVSGIYVVIYKMGKSMSKI